MGAGIEALREEVPTPLVLHDLAVEQGVGGVMFGVVGVEGGWFVLEGRARRVLLNTVDAPPQVGQLLTEVRLHVSRKGA